MSELLEVKQLKTHFPIHGGLLRRVVNYVRAVDGVSFTMKPQETLGLVGESGCGKSTVGRTIIHLTPPSSGQVVFQGKDLETLSHEELVQVRLKMQLIFQNPTSSLNPRMTVEEILTDALINHKLVKPAEARQKVASLMEACGLSPLQLQRYPHEFSGGQRQRICIARALTLNPQLVICDESVSALDVSVQAQILNLLKDLQKEFHVSYLFISHDMGVIRFIADRIAVMYLGRIVELADKPSLFENPKHPYTQALLSAIPVSHPSQKRQRIVLQGEVPSPTRIYSGCSFADRCPAVQEACRHEVPQLQEVGSGHQVACLRVQSGEL